MGGFESLHRMEALDPQNGVGNLVSNRKHNPEKRAWRGKSYKKSGHGGAKTAPRVRDLRDKARQATS